MIYKQKINKADLKQSKCLIQGKLQLYLLLDWRLVFWSLNGRKNSNNAATNNGSDHI